MKYQNNQIINQVYIGCAMRQHANVFSFQYYSKENSNFGATWIVGEKSLSCSSYSYFKNHSIQPVIRPYIHFSLCFFCVFHWKHFDRSKFFDLMTELRVDIIILNIFYDCFCTLQRWNISKYTVKSANNLCEGFACRNIIKFL